MTESVFALGDHLAGKDVPELITDEQHFAAIATCLARKIADLSDRLGAERKAPGGLGQKAMDRDMEIHRLTSQLRTLQRFGLDMCLGRMMHEDAPVYVGRLGLTDDRGRQLLVDWRSPAAEPFFGATHANPMGLVSRRRYRWDRGRISDYWDEVFVSDGAENAVALDDQSAFIASLGANRTARMRDVLGTIAADQNAIVRAGSRGACVVDGGPGTGKTVVALHRAAYLLHADPRLGHRQGGVLVVGPHRPYLAYVADVLPNLGEDDVQMCILDDFVAESAVAPIETDAAAAKLKSSGALISAIDEAVKFYEEPPKRGMRVAIDWSDVWLSATEWAAAFDAPESATPHNEAREQIWDELAAILWDKYDGDASHGQFQNSLRRDHDLVTTLNRAWPLLEATDIVADLWSVPAYLRKCAPWLSADEVRLLQRREPYAWTRSDMPFLDAARARLGDAQAGRPRTSSTSGNALELEQRAKAIDDLLASEFDGEGALTMLHGEDLRETLEEEAAQPDHDRLAGPFAHIIVDEAQELTDAQWQMLLLRCPSRSFTIVGDRAQARHGFTESWRERLTRVGFDQVNLSSLTINYRTPLQVMAEAEPVIKAALPDANVPTSVRQGEVPVIRGHVSQLGTILHEWEENNEDGTACVIGDPTFEGAGRVRSLTPQLSKGLEFDLVVLIDPDSFGDGIEGAVDRYVATTRATQQLAILTRDGNVSS